MIKKEEEMLSAVKDRQSKVVKCFVSLLKYLYYGGGLYILPLFYISIIMVRPLWDVVKF